MRIPAILTTHATGAGHRHGPNVGLGETLVSDSLKAFFCKIWSGGGRGVGGAVAMPSPRDWSKSSSQLRPEMPVNHNRHHKKILT